MRIEARIKNEKLEKEGEKTIIKFSESVIKVFRREIFGHLNPNQRKQMYEVVSC